MDSGELATAVATFGIPHPTGYPLYLLIGYLFANLPFGSSVIYKLNLLSAILSALAVYVTFFTVYEFLNIVIAKPPSKSKGKEDKKKKAQEKKPDIVHDLLAADSGYFKPIFALSAAILFGITRTFWQNALSVEVYPLHVLFLSLILLYLLKVYSNTGSGNYKLWVVLFLLIGLSFTNHMTTIFVIPAVLYLFYIEYTKNRQFAKNLLKRVPVFILPLIFYFILMFRSSSEPFMNWSAPATISNLLYHVTGGDYSQMMFSSGSFSKQFKIFYSEFFNELAVITGILGLIGFIYLYRLEKKIFVLFILPVIFCLLYSMYYGIRDIQSYFLTSYYFITVSSAIGFVWLMGIVNIQFKFNKRSSFAFLIVLCLIVIGFSLNYNYKGNDNSRNYIIEDYTINALKDLDSNSIVITYDWGYLYPAALYYQQVEHFRQDIKIFNVKFLSVPWYLDMIKKYHPDIYANIQKEAEFYKSDYTSELSIRSQALTNLVKAFVEKNRLKYKMFASYDFAYSGEIKPMFPNISFQSFGLLYRINDKNAPYDSNAGINSLSLKFRDYKPWTSEADKMMKATAGNYYDNAIYHWKNGNNFTAIRFIDKSLEIKPDFANSISLKNKLVSQQDTVK